MDAENWIKWKGGECPEEPDTVVEVRFRHKNTLARRPQPASVYYWKHSGERMGYGGGDIIEYRVVPPSPTMRARDAIQPMV